MVLPINSRTRSYRSVDGSCSSKCAKQLHVWINWYGHRVWKKKFGGWWQDIQELAKDLTQNAFLWAGCVLKRIFLDVGSRLCEQAVPLYRRGDGDSRRKPVGRLQIGVQYGVVYIRMENVRVESGIGFRTRKPVSLKPCISKQKNAGSFMLGCVNLAWDQDKNGGQKKYRLYRNPVTI